MFLKLFKPKFLIFYILILLFGGLGSKWQYNISAIDTISEVINLLRFLIFFTAPIIFYFFFKYSKKYKFNNNMVLNCFYLIFLIQLIGFANFYFLNQSLYEEKLIDQNLIENGYNLRFSYSFYIGFALVIPLPLMALLINKPRISSEAIKISIIFLATITTLYLSKVVYEFFIDNKIYFYHLSFLTWGKILDVSAPRATGISRWLIIIYIFCISTLFLSKKNNLILFSLLIIIGTFIYLFQSRTSVYFLVFVTFFLIFKDKKFIQNLLSIIIIYSSIYIISSSVSHYKHNSIMKEVQEKIKIVELEITELKKNDTPKSDLTSSEPIDVTLNNRLKNLQNTKKNYKLKENSRNFGDENNYSTGRVEIWKELYPYIFKSKISNLLIGYGAQSDRYFSGQNASSAIVYIFITSGLLGFILFSIICLNILYLILKIFRNRKQIDIKKFRNRHILFCIICLFFLMCRSLVEISFTSFGLDYLFFLVCFVNLYNFIRDLENTQNKNH